MGEAVPLDVTRLGRFQILKHLATGGMAEVLLAQASGPGGSDHVVIKRVRRDQAQDPQFVKMFMDEATLAASLQHPNIVRVHEIGSDQGEFFFSMEYVHGEDLRRVLLEVSRRRDKVPIALVTGIVAAAAAGLHHAHNQRGANGEALGIVHRDVSPANILIGYDGQVKVADFGIAKAALRTVETQSGTLKGKVSYMSPELSERPVSRPRSDRQPAERSGAPSARPTSRSKATDTATTPRLPRPDPRKVRRRESSQPSVCDCVPFVPRLRCFVFPIPPLLWDFCSQPQLARTHRPDSA